jgi:hypothetical protein
MISSLLVVFFFFETLFHFTLKFFSQWYLAYWVSWEDKEKKEKRKTKNWCKTLCSIKPLAMGFTSIGHTLGSTLHVFFGFLKGKSQASSVN